MGFSTFGSKPHLAKKRKRDGLPDAERRGSNSLLPGSPDQGSIGVNAAVAVDTHLSENNEDANRGIMETGEDEANEDKYRRNEDEDTRDRMVSSASESAQTSNLDTERMTSLSERKTLPVLPPGMAATSTTKMTTGTESGSGYDFAALRYGVRNQNGDVAYYNYSFVEDPWKELR